MMADELTCPKCGAALKHEGSREMVFGCDTVTTAPMYTLLVISQSRRCVERERDEANARIAELTEALTTLVRVTSPFLLHTLPIGAAPLTIADEQALDAAHEVAKAALKGGA